MPDYTNFLGLYKPNRNDALALDTTLADNFSTIDSKLGSALVDEEGTTYSNLNDRLAQFKRNANDVEFVVNALEQSDIKADGTYDDTNGIQRLLDLALTHNGVKIHFPAGDYSITRELRLAENTHIVADRGAVFTKKHTGAFLLNLLPTDSMSGYNGNGHITISGGVWNANYPAFGGGTSFIIGHADGFLMEGLDLLNHGGGHAIELAGVKNGVIHNCGFFGFDDLGGTRTYSEAIQLDVAKSSGTFPWGGSSFDSTPCTEIWIDSNRFGASAQLGAWGRAVGTHSATIGKKQTKINITNNYMKGMLQWAVRAYNWEEFNISNNVIADCGMGINIRTAITGVDTEDANGNQVGSEELRNGVIANNIIQGGLTVGRAIEIYGEAGTSGRNTDMVVVGNSIRSSSAINDGIQVHIADRITIQGNTVNGCMDGIAISDCYDATILGNILINNEHYGVQAYGTTAYVTIVGNNIRLPLQSCIYITGIDTAVIANNTLSGANREAGAGSANNHIRLTSGVDRVSITGNAMRNYGSVTTTHAVYVTSSCTNVTMTGNAGAGFILYNGAGQPADTHGNLGTVT